LAGTGCECVDARVADERDPVRARRGAGGDRCGCPGGASYDAIIAVDTLYFAFDLAATVR
jgi:hypothetical protein